MSEKEDLTRIEDLQEFLHEDEPPEKDELSEDDEAEFDFSDSDNDHIESDEPIVETSEEEDLFAELSGELPLNKTLPEGGDAFAEEPPPFEQEHDDEQEEKQEEEQQSYEEELDPLPVLDAPSPPPQSEGSQALEEIQKFSAQVTYGQLSLGQGPPFSVVIRNVKDQEVRDEINQLLNEVGLDPRQFDQGLSLGQILVGQISEYCAIFLAHKLRNLDVEIELGLSDLIHPSRNYQNEAQRGTPQLPSNNQSREEGQDFRQWQYGEFFISNSSHTPYTVKEHLGSIQALRKISSEQLSELPSPQDINSSDQEDYHELLNQYQGLVEELKGRALKRGAHGLTQLSFQLTPLASADDENIHYQLLALGHLVRF